MRRLLLHFGFFEVSGPGLGSPAKDETGCPTQKREHRAIVEIEVSLALSPFWCWVDWGALPENALSRLGAMYRTEH